jgi:hypothetical protein
MTVRRVPAPTVSKSISRRESGAPFGKSSFRHDWRRRRPNSSAIVRPVMAPSRRLNLPPMSPSILAGAPVKAAC